MDIVRCERPWPAYSGFVGALLDGRRHDAGEADAVAAHHERLLDPVLVEEGRLERERVARSELEDVADLDRRLEGELTPAKDAAVIGRRDAQVGETGLEVPPELDAAQVPAGAVRAGDELA